MLTFGSEGAYEWLVTDQQFDLLQLCPEIVLGKYVAITFHRQFTFYSNCRRNGGWLAVSGRYRMEP